MEKQYVDQFGIPLPVNYDRVKDRGDLVHQLSPRRKIYYKLYVNDMVFVDFGYLQLGDKAFRIFCYLGGKILYNNISYVNGKEVMKLFKLDRRVYYAAIKELKEKALIKEVDFRPMDKSDRIFLVSPAYFWYGGPNRLGEVKRWYFNGK